MVLVHSGGSYASSVSPQAATLQRVSSFTYTAPDPAKFLQAMVKYLEGRKRHDISTLLRCARCAFTTAGQYSRVRWNGYDTTFRVTVPIDTLPAFSDEIQAEILKAADLLLSPDIGYDLTGIEIAPAFDEEDLDTPVESRAPTVHVAWNRLTDDQFERLIFDLVNTSRGYRNAQWLTHTNAPDDGRDLAVERVFEDTLAGARVFRVIVACRHWTARTTSPAEIAMLREQMRLWEPPLVDVLVIATSGRFSTPAVRLIDKQNQSDSALRIEPWPNSHLEALLARRRDLLVSYGLEQTTAHEFSF